MSSGSALRASSFVFVPSMKRLLLSSLLIDHTSCFFSHCRTTVPNAANHAAGAASSVTLLCVLCVANVSPAHDKKRGVRHHLRDDRQSGHATNRAHHAIWWLRLSARPLTPRRRSGPPDTPSHRARPRRECAPSAAPARRRRCDGRAGRLNARPTRVTRHAPGVGATRPTPPGPAPPAPVRDRLS